MYFMDFHFLIFFSWDELKEEAEERKKELVACLYIQNLYSEMTETRSWMIEKSRLLASVEDPGVDLSSVITLQRRLNTIERDIAALPSKVSFLNLVPFRSLSEFFAFIGVRYPVATTLPTDGIVQLMSEK